MSEIKKLIDRLLTNGECGDHYHKRKNRYPKLAELACLPSNVADISNDILPWHCHGLAFRMATYSDESEKVFALMNELLKLPQQSDGWDSELKKWMNANDHWAKKWDKNFQFLWLLQCFEYFKKRGYRVTFPGNNGKAAPDLKICRGVGDPVFVECTVYSKWWFNEIILEDILFITNPRLSIRRTWNIVRDISENPFSKDMFPSTLEGIAQRLTPECLVKASAEAEKASPYILYACEYSDLKVLLNGDGEYQGSDNAQGDPSYSRPVFLDEIIKNKEKKNNLKNSRDNILMVNGLGFDFQTSMSCWTRHASIDDKFESEGIDEIWVAVCGIDEVLQETDLRQKFLRRDYAGSAITATVY